MSNPEIVMLLSGFLNPAEISRWIYCFPAKGSMSITSEELLIKQGSTVFPEAMHEGLFKESKS